MLIIWWIVQSLSPHDLHLLFCWLLFFYYYYAIFFYINTSLLGSPALFEVSKLILVVFSSIWLQIFLWYPVSFPGSSRVFQELQHMIGIIVTFMFLVLWQGPAFHQSSLSLSGLLAQQNSVVFFLSINSRFYQLVLGSIF